MECFCDCCGRRLCSEETVQSFDDVYGEVYVRCVYCGGECAFNKEGSDEWGESDCGEW